MRCYNKLGAFVKRTTLRADLPLVSRMAKSRSPATPRVFTSSVLRLLFFSLPWSFRLSHRCVRLSPSSGRGSWLLQPSWG